jgi:2-polyprenyl-6-methoxyphenol hydroxylase-like FAD-dependent oxidoreductase
MVGQDKHEAILRNHLAKHGCSVELGTEFVSMSQDSEKVQSVIRHADGKEEIITSSWLIGADGGRSAVRKTMNVTFLGEERTEKGMLLGDFYMKNSGELGSVRFILFSLDERTKTIRIECSSGTYGERRRAKCTLIHCSISHR